MRILLTNHFPYSGSGTGTYVRDLAWCLRRAGHQVHALIIDHVANSVAGQEDPCPTIRIVCGADSPDSHLKFDFPCFTGHPYSANTFGHLSPSQVRAYKAVTRLRIGEAIESFAPDVVHCQHLWVQADLVRSFKIPYVVSAQGTDLMGYLLYPRFRNSAQHAATHAGRILAASNFIKGQVVSTFPRAVGKVQMLYSAINPFPYQYPSPPRTEALRALNLPTDVGPVVAYLGKLVPFKGVEVLLEAARNYAQSPLDICTVICGDGPLRQPLQIAARQAAPGRIWFVGNRPVHERAWLLALADLVVVPSHVEPFGLVALEAMACGTPIIASNAGGIAEIVSDETGALVKPGDPHALASAVLAAIAERWKQTKGNLARRYVKTRHDPGAWVASIERVYGEVAARDVFAGRRS